MNQAHDLPTAPLLLQVLFADLTRRAFYRDFLRNTHMGVSDIGLKYRSVPIKRFSSRNLSRILESFPPPANGVLVAHHWPQAGDRTARPVKLLPE